MSTKDLVTIEVCMKLPEELVEGLKDVVKATGMSQEELITHYVTEGVLSAMPKVKRKLFFNSTKEILKKHNIPDDAVDEIIEKFTY